MVTVEQTGGTRRNFSVEIPKPFGYFRVKRILDVVLASCLGILVFLPLFLVIGPVLWFGGSIFYSHIRIGIGGRRFRCYKFRTMLPNADRILPHVIAADIKARLQWDRYRKITADPRVTRIGRILRTTSLDELPQLWNVLKGDMSLVGPRPIVDEEIPCYSRYFPRYVSARPGLTGVWQVYGRDRAVEYRRRVAMDVWYVRNYCFWVDCCLLAKTVRVVLRRGGT